MKSYENLIKEIEQIGKIVQKLPQTVQSDAFKLMANKYLEDDEKVVEDKKEFDNIASFENGVYAFLVKDPKGKSSIDSAKRIIYIIIRTYTLLTGEGGVSRKNIINPELEKWRLNTGNTRSFIANNKGIIKNGDLFSLDNLALKEADRYIAQLV